MQLLKDLSVQEKLDSDYNLVGYQVAGNDDDLKKNSRLFDYVFISPQDKNDYLCVLGYGMLYNHSYKPNVEWRILEEDNRFIAFEAIKNIKVGDEIVHDYGKGYWETRKEKVNG